MAGILQDIGKTGKLPTISTSVDIGKDGIINLAVALVVIVVVSMLVYKLLFK